MHPEGEGCEFRRQALAADGEQGDAVKRVEPGRVAAGDPGGLQRGGGQSLFVVQGDGVRPPRRRAREYGDFEGARRAGGGQPEAAARGDRRQFDFNRQPGGFPGGEELSCPVPGDGFSRRVKQPPAGFETGFRLRVVDQREPFPERFAAEVVAASVARRGGPSVEEGEPGSESVRQRRSDGSGRLGSISL